MMSSLPVLVQDFGSTNLVCAEYKRGISQGYIEMSMLGHLPRRLLNTNATPMPFINRAASKLQRRQTSDQAKTANPQ